MDNYDPTRNSDVDWSSVAFPISLCIRCVQCHFLDFRLLLVDGLQWIEHETRCISFFFSYFVPCHCRIQLLSNFLIIYSNDFKEFLILSEFTYVFAFFHLKKCRTNFNFNQNERSGWAIEKNRWLHLLDPDWSPDAPEQAINDHKILLL